MAVAARLQTQHEPLLRNIEDDDVLVISTSPVSLPVAPLQRKRPFTCGYVECLSPKTKKVIDRFTGEISREVAFRYDPVTGRYIPTRCGTTDCGPCSIMNGRRIAGAIWLAQPDYLLTLTLVGNTYEEIRTNINALFKAMRKTYPTLMHTWQAEWNPGGTGAHTLSYLHLDDRSISPAVVGECWPHHFLLQRVLVNAAPPFFDYQMKSLTDDDERVRYIDLNNSPTTTRPTLVHASPGFWRDGKSGETMTRARAEVVANKRRRAS